ncbi:MAG: ABC-2 type transport system permease protein [Arenicella sp.]|jgi:ABC-2 type transport system permease protein
MNFLIDIHWLTLKEIRSVLQDTSMLIFVIYAFSLSIYLKASGQGDDVNNASVAIVDQDRSALSGKIMQGFYPPDFKRVELIDSRELNNSMDRGRYIFVLEIPNGFEASLHRGQVKQLQLNVDSTAARQASLGASYITAIVTQAIENHLPQLRQRAPELVNLITRRAFNPNGSSGWFHGILGFLDHITMVTIILTGAALLREREHGTIEHLLVMPLNSFQIAISKIAANGMLILILAMLSLRFVVMGAIGAPVTGSLWLFTLGTVVYLFSAAAIGVLLATIARSMAQFSLLLIMVILPMQMLSGGMSPIEDQPSWLQSITFFFPSRHYLEFSQGVLYRGAEIDVLWPEFIYIAILGATYLSFSLSLFRRSIDAS